jgi:hypothetical protein
MDTEVRREVAFFAPALTCPFFLGRDLSAWAEVFGDLDHIFEGRRVTFMSEIKKLEELIKRGILSCESPSQVVLRGQISTHFTRLGWFNPEKPGPLSSIRLILQSVNEMRVKSLKPIAVALYTAMDAAAGSPFLEVLKERVTKFESLCQAMRIFNRLVSSQYPSGKEGEVLPRTSELALLAALDRMLGVSSLMNCKSGCDRAGLVRDAVHL